MTAPVDIQAVTFGLGDEVFALPVGLVREILDHVPASRMPHAPDWLLGLIDVRGRAVPTVDLRVRLGLAQVAITAATRLLVIDVPVENTLLALALVVDRVMDVRSFGGANIAPPPDIGIRWSSNHIEGVVNDPSGFVMLLDAARVFSSDTAILVQNLSRAA